MSDSLDAIECLLVMEELDTEPTVEQHGKAIDGLAVGKASGSDGISPDLTRHCKTTLLLPLHKALCLCWKEGAVPQDMRDAKITTLYKNKGKRSDCNSIVLVGKSLPESFLYILYVSRNSLIASTQNHNVASGQRDQQLTWCFPSVSSKKNVENNGFLSTSHSLISPRHLTW